MASFPKQSPKKRATVQLIDKPIKSHAILIGDRSILEFCPHAIG